MNSLKKYCVTLCAVLVLALAAGPAGAAVSKKEAAKKAPGSEIVEHGWAQRCPKTDAKQKPDSKQCEVFQRIDMKGSSTRVAEFAIGFPQVKGMPSGAARGVVILPLGIMLEQGAHMKIEGEKRPLAFKPRFCTNGGCFSYLTLNKNVLEAMKKAKSVTFIFKTADGRRVNLIMGLTGFEKALQGIKG